MKKIMVVIIVVTIFIFLIFNYKDRKQKEKPTRWSEIGLYFYDKDAQYFVRVPKKVLKENNTPEFALQELIKGPQSKLYIPVVPKNAKVRNFYIQSDIAIVDFDKALLSYGGGATYEIGIIGGIVLTLTDFKEIKCVQFLIESEKKEYLPEGIEILKPICRKDVEKLIKK